jgi:hypothetical protein
MPLCCEFHRIKIHTVNFTIASLCNFTGLFSPLKAARLEGIKGARKDQRSQARLSKGPGSIDKKDQRGQARLSKGPGSIDQKKSAAR